MATTNVGTLEVLLALKDQLSPAMSGIMGKVADMAGGMLTMAGTIKLATDALKAQGEQEAAINKLNLALANQGKYTAETSDALVEYAGALQDASTFSDDVILDAQAMLVTFGQNEEQVKRSTKAAIDFAAATGTDLKTAVNLLGKAFVGETGALSRYGIVVQEGLTETQKFDAVIKQLEGRFGGSALVATQSFAGQMEVLKNQVGEVQEGAGKFLGTVLDLGSGTSFAVTGLKMLSEFFGKTMIIALSEARAQVLLFFATLAEGASQAGALLSGPLGQLLTGGIGGSLVKPEQVQGLKDLAGALRVQADQVRDVGDKSAAAAGKVQTFSNNTNVLARVSKEAAEAARKLREETQKILDMEAAASYDAMANELKEFAKEGAAEAALSLEAMTAEAKELKDADLAQEANEATESFEGMSDELKDLEKTITKTFKGTLLDSLKSLPGVILGAIQGGGDVGKAIGTSIGGDLGTALGKETAKAIGGSLGSALGSIMGPLGSIVGSFAGDLIGKGIGALAGAFGIGGDKVIMKVNDMRDAFFDAHGGFEALALELGAAGNQDLVRRIFDAKTVEEFNALVAETQGLLGLQGQAQEDLNAAVEKYGFTIDELGPKWKQQELDKMAGELLKDYELLVASGIDVNTVIARMGPNLLEYVNTARAAGGAIPEAMRPVIEQLIASGQLLDENGNAFESVEEAGISFTQSLSEGLASVIEEIRNLVAALTGVPRNVTTTVTTRHEDEYGRRGDEGEYDHRAAAGFNGMVFGPTSFLTGERGPEHVQVTPGGPPSGAGFDDRALVAEISAMRRELPQDMARAVVHALQTGSR